MMSFLLLLILPTYAVLSIITYAWSLGGFKFHIFMNQVDDISIDVNGRYLALPIVFIIVGYLLIFLIPVIHGILLYSDLYKNYLENMFGTLFAGVYADYIGIHTFFAFLYSIIGFAPRPKVKVKNIAEIE